MIRLLVLRFARENVNRSTMRGPAGVEPTLEADRQAESVKGEPRVRRRPRRRLLSARLGCSAELACPDPRRHVRRCGWHRGRQSRLTAQDLQLLRLTLCLLRRLLRLLGLLRHTALLAMMRWRYRNSALANRDALRSDYYSNTQKTANPLNEWWTTTARRNARSARRSAHPHVRGRVCSVFRQVRARFSRNSRNHCGTGTSLMHVRSRSNHEIQNISPGEVRKEKQEKKRGRNTTKSLPSDSRRAVRSRVLTHIQS